MTSRAHLALVALLISLSVVLVSAALWAVGPTVTTPYQGVDGFTPEASQRESSAAAETPTATAPAREKRNNNADRPAARRHLIELDAGPYFAKPFETIQIAGRYPAAGVSSKLRVQRQRGGGWVSWPLPTVPDRSGDFTAFVELGRPDRYRVRVVDPQQQGASNTVLVNIR